MSLQNRNAYIKLDVEFSPTVYFEIFSWLLDTIHRGVHSEHHVRIDRGAFYHQPHHIRSRVRRILELGRGRKMVAHVLHNVINFQNPQTKHFSVLNVVLHFGL